MWWQADLRAKGPAQVELVRARMVSEGIECDLVVEALAKELDRAAHRARVLALRARDCCERGDRLGDGDLEREPSRVGLHGAVEALESGAAGVSRRDVRMDANFAVRALHGIARQGHDLIRGWAVAR